MFVDLLPRMLGTSIDKFRTLVSKEKWDQLIPVLLRLDPSVAASIFMDIPAAQQDELFRRLPIEFAANWSRFFLIATCMFCCTRVRAKTGLPSQTTSSRPRGSGFQRSCLTMVGSSS